MISTNWKEIVHPGIVEFMAENAKFVNGVPNIASITRAGIKADLSGKYDNPRVFTNEEIQRQVGLLHEGGTPIACIRWYRNNLGPRRTTARAGFKEAYALYKEQGKSIPVEALAEIAEANLHVIFGARGADLTKLSEFKIMENFQTAMEEKKQKMQEEKITKMQAAKEAKAKAKAEKEAAKKEATEKVEAAAKDAKAEPKAEAKKTLKVKK